MPRPRGVRYVTCRNGHVLSDPTVYIRPDNGQRECRVCRRERSKRWYYRKRLNEHRAARAERSEAPGQ